MMTRFTRTANYLFRGSILLALGTAAMEVVTGGILYFSIFSQAHTRADVVSNVSQLDFSGLMLQGEVLVVILMVATLLSLLAFKNAGRLTSICRTIILTGTTAASIIGFNMFLFTDLLIRHTNGTLTISEIDRTKDLFRFSGNGILTNTVMIRTAGVTGAFITLCVTGVLLVLTVTSVVSIVKTVRSAERVKTVKVLPCAV